MGETTKPPRVMVLKSYFGSEIGTGRELYMYRCEECGYQRTEHYRGSYGRECFHEHPDPDKETSR